VTSKEKTILVVDDEERIRRILYASLGGRGHKVLLAENGLDAIGKLDGSIDLVLTDLKMPERDGLDVLQRVVDLGLDAPVIVMTAYGTVDSAVAAMKKGAYDYVTKPFNLDEVELLVDRALQSTMLAREHRYLREEQGQGLDCMIGTSPAMREVFERVRKIAASDASVLITGETGTGKELVARAIHSLSHRHERLFVAVNCAAIPHELLESELFGHTRGAFTGATRDRDGKFELANEGSLFLDEIADMAPELQAKILRVLEEQRVTKIGSSREVKVDVRVISATNRNLDTAIAAGAFRDDLYYRLNVIELRLPPLSERVGDIPLLTEHFLALAAGRGGRPPLRLTGDAIELLQSYSWPGNVRELRNVCERLSVLCDGDQIAADVVSHLIDLPGPPAPSISPGAPVGMTLSEAVSRAEIDAIERALESTGGNKAQAARTLGISERNLWYKLKKYAGKIRSEAS